ncbi:hypothetical protein [Streptomyces hoynatensis]|uniref:hypothetical protein n=1 Tax=Streptomyces hoynatensis TaxID=1141874 RepID=UPI00131A0C26|nr:hypothetical protein [Streptomyces hoynatensis]
MRHTLRIAAVGAIAAAVLAGGAAQALAAPGQDGRAAAVTDSPQAEPYDHQVTGSPE